QSIHQTNTPAPTYATFKTLACILPHLREDFGERLLLVCLSRPAQTVRNKCLGVPHLSLLPSLPSTYNNFFLLSRYAQAQAQTHSGGGGGAGSGSQQ
ncbi:hypothetical protein KC19_10G017100, partial [Ceratodon purpureus]